MMKSLNSNVSIEIEGKEIHFNQPITKILIIDSKILILLKGEPLFLKNIQAFDCHGRKLWVVEELEPFQGRPSIITGLYSREGKAIAYLSYGIEYEIDLDSGKLIKISNQRPW